jgi:PhnB protein
MSITLNPYLNFRGEAKEAIAFYASVFGGEPTVTTFAEGGMAEQLPDDDGGLVMHSEIKTPLGLVLMCADAPSTMPVSVGNNVTVSLSGDDADTLAAYWNGLAEGATVTMPFEVAPWGDRFGMLTDRFGIEWMINSVAPAS